MKAPAIIKEFTGAGGVAAFTTSGPMADPVRKIPKKKKGDGLKPDALVSHVVNGYRKA